MEVEHLRADIEVKRCDNEMFTYYRRKAECSTLQKQVFRLFDEPIEVACWKIPMSNFFYG